MGKCFPLVVKLTNNHRAKKLTSEATRFQQGHFEFKQGWKLTKNDTKSNLQLSSLKQVQNEDWKWILDVSMEDVCGRRWVREERRERRKEKREGNNKNKQEEKF